MHVICFQIKGTGNVKLHNDACSNNCPKYYHYQETISYN